MQVMRRLLVHQIRNEGRPVAMVCRELRVSRKTAYKWLKRFDTDPDCTFDDHSRRPLSSPNEVPENVRQQIIQGFDRTGFGARRIRRALSSEGVNGIPSTTTVHKFLQQNGRSPSKAFDDADGWCDALLRNLIAGAERTSVRTPSCSNQDFEDLIDLLKNGKRRQRRRAAVLILLAFGASRSMAARVAGSSRGTTKRYRDEFQTSGVESVRRHRPGKDQSEPVREAVIGLLHTPPSSHGINRTSWRLRDLSRTLRAQGNPVSVAVIRKVIRSSGYRWTKARKVLTSNDPEYKRKLGEIQSILSGLREDERFFSIDELGPVAIKQRGGKRLVGPGVRPTIPQHQKSKGKLIVTAALELSRNQVTHFFAERKSTAEMVKLMHMLLVQYGGCRRLYFSWDAASWHASKELSRQVDLVNDPNYRRKNGTPFVMLAPLPACAQFLNVIESVFSGLVRAVIHNSNYGSVEDAKKAVDVYFQERNEHFRVNPKKAGRKIWGEELVPSAFSESQNCKDPRW